MGTFLAVFAYIIWGLLPIYWKEIQHVPALEILCHRVVWSFLFLLILQTIGRRWQGFRAKLKIPKNRILYVGSACIITFNWGLYVWAVNAGFIVEASLGYFINPLVSVVLGVVLLKERLRWGKWLAVGLAASGVLFMTVQYGVFPWIALVLACTFGIYGFIRKTGALDAVGGLTFETGVFFLPMLISLLVLEIKGTGSFGHVPVLTNLFLVLTGFATSFPLILFAAAARRIPLSMLGILQYILPTMLFILGVFVYDEPFSTARLIGFIFVWVALFIYAAEGFITNQYKTSRTMI